MRRAVGIVRLSVMTKSSDSPERQREIILAKAAGRGSEVVGWADDLDISATKYPPDRRPELAKWLARPDDLDEFIFWRFDRFIRKPGDLARMIDWSHEHSKGLLSATEDFDLDTPFGEACAYMAAIFARMETVATSLRVTGEREYLRRNGRWGGGRAPYGYLAIRNPDGKGWVLVVDPEAAEIIREVAGRVIAGEAIHSIVADLNQRGIPSPRERTRALWNASRPKEEPERPLRNAPWGFASMKGILSSPALLGYAVYNGEVVTDEEGLPVRMAEAILLETTWDDLQRELADPRRTKQRDRTNTPSMLLGVAHCALCLRRLSRSSSVTPKRVYPYYRCPASVNGGAFRERCESLSVRAEELEEIAAEHFLSVVGEDTVMNRIYEAGSDTAEEQAQVRRSLATVRAEYDRGGYSYPGGQDEYDTRVTRLSDRLRALGNIRVVKPGYRLVPTRETFRARWEGASVPERRKLMTGAGFVGAYAKLKDGRVLQVWSIDQAMRAAARAAASGEVVIAPEMTDTLERVLMPARQAMGLA